MAVNDFNWGEAAKSYAMETLFGEGYDDFATLLSYFRLYPLDGTKDIAYMIPGKGQIFVNRNIDPKALSFLIRHEIMHEFADHGPRATAYHGGEENYRKLNSFEHDLNNIAADLHLCNMMYSFKDKQLAKRIRLLNPETNKFEIHKGLVTEKDFPTLVKYAKMGDFEALLDELRKIKKEEIERMKQMNDLINNIVINPIEKTHSKEYTDAYNKVIDAFGGKDVVSEKDLEDILAKLGGM